MLKVLLIQTRVGILYTNKCSEGIAYLRIFEWDYSTSRFEFDTSRCDQRVL